MRLEGADGQRADPLASGTGRFSPPVHLPTLPVLYPPCLCFLLALGVFACWDPPSPQRERPLAADDLRTVQTSLLGLAREFLVRSSPTDDMQVLLSFLAAAGDDGQVGWRLVTGLCEGCSVGHVGTPGPV